MGRVRLKELFKVSLASPDETLAFGRNMAADLPAHAILALSGDLGAGKTTFVQGLGTRLGVLEPIQSPTFVILNIYKSLFHFDLYRLKTASEFTSLGFEEYFEREGICAIEWPDRIAHLLPSRTLHIDFSYDGEKRIATVRS